MHDYLLTVKNLKVGFLNEQTRHYNDVVHHFDLTIKKGQVVALVGESGSGKSVSAMALIKLLPARKARIIADEINYYSANQSINLATQTAKQLQRIRGKEIAVIFQDPLSALNPVQHIGKQIEEVFALHRADLKKSAYRSEAIKLLDKVGITPAQEKVRSYPHQLSGGMRQRVLDVTIQAQILSLLQDLQDEYRMGILFISHDLAVVRALSDYIVVMYQGKVVETNATETLIKHPQHPYTKQLLSASRLR